MTIIDKHIMCYVIITEKERKYRLKLKMNYAYKHITVGLLKYDKLSECKVQIETKQTAYEWIHTEEDNQICNKEVSKGRIYKIMPCYYTGHYINDTDSHSCFAYLILKYLWRALHGYTMMLFSCTECDTNINRNTGLSDEYTTFQWIYFQSNNCTMWDKWSFDILAYLKCRYKI